MSGSLNQQQQQQQEEEPLVEPLIQESNLTEDSCHRSFVVEKDELFALLALLFNTYPANAEKNFEPLQDVLLSQRKVTRVIVIIEFYQEQSYLLDPHLEKMVVPLINYIENEIRASLPSSSSSSSPIHPKHTITVHNFLRHAFKILYTIVKVRGSKTVTRFFPHEVSDLFPVFSFLQLPKDKTSYELWEVRYILILWLGCIIITPFHFGTIDHLFNSPPLQSFDDIKTNQGLINNLLGICVDCLHESGKPRDASAELLSRLLTRPDMSHHLNIFFEWAKQKISSENLKKSLLSEAALMAGVLNTLASILKRGKRQELLNEIPNIFVLVSNLYREIQEGSSSGNSIVIREWLVKVIQRIGLVYLKPRVASWRYQRGNRLLMLNTNSSSGSSQKAKQAIEEVVDENFDDVPECMEDIIDILINALNDKDTVVRWSAAKGIGRISGRLPQSMALDVVSAVEDLLSPSNNPSDSVWHGACLAIAEFARRGLLLPEKLSTIISFVKQALVYDVAVGSHSIGSHIRDAACYVSWAFARAYSPEILKPYVSVLAPMLIIVGLLDREVNCRRAASAAFQENAGRQGNFPHGIEIITTADYFSLGNRNESYLVVTPKVAQFEEYKRPIIDHLVNIKISHWDRALRVLASQTLGILTPIDPHYMLENVLPSIISWTISPDLNLRHGALLSVGEIILGLSNYFQTSNQTVPYSSLLIQSVKNIIPLIESAKLNKGHGGELVRGALCRMIQCLSMAHFPSNNESNENSEDIDETKNPKDTKDSSILSLNIPISSSGPLPSAKQIARRQALLGNAPKVEKSKDFVQLLQDTLDDNLKLSKFEIQEAAMIALKDFALEYYVRVQPSNSNSPATLIKRYTKLIRTDPAPATRRGCCRAIGVLPKSILKPHIDESIDVLCKASQEQSPEFKDAEMRLLATQALHKVFLTMMTTTDEQKIDHENTLSLDLIHLIFKTFQKGTEDYSSDNRGDVGSWVREASIFALQSIVNILSSSPHLLSLKNESQSSSDVFSLESIVRSTVCLYLKQVTERMDKIRSVAGSCIESLLKSNTPFIPHRKELEEHLLPKDVSINWGSPSDTYHRIIPLIENDDFRHPIILGLITSVGDISKNLADESRTCLVSYLFSARKEGNPVYSQFWTTFIKILEEEQRNERVIVPAFKTLVLLFGGEGMSRDSYENPLFPLDNEVLAKIFSLVTVEIKNSNDIVKIIAAVPVLCGILSSPTSTQKQSLKHLLTLLVHKYPKVRRLCADSLYTKLLTDERVWNLIRSFSKLNPTFREENFEVILELLSTVNWDGDLDVAKHERMNLYPLFGLPKPVIVQKQTPPPQQQPTSITVSSPMITIVENKPNPQNTALQKQSVTPPQPVVDDPDEL